MKTKVGIILVTALLVFYLIVTAQRGILLVASGEVVPILLGLALLILPVIGAWALIRELLFGRDTEKLAKVLEAEGGLPPDDLPRSPGGRINRKAADEAFVQYREEAEERPDDWRSWFRLSCAYDVSGDRKRARQSMRTAIAMFKTSGSAQQQVS